jgi:hypothetical protein
VDLGRSAASRDAAGVHFWPAKVVFAPFRLGPRATVTVDALECQRPGCTGTYSPPRRLDVSVPAVRHVVVVEDHDDSREIMREILEHGGFCVSEARTAIEAVTSRNSLK